MDISKALTPEPPCPHCDHHMALKTDQDRERGYCDFCAMTKFKAESGFRLIPREADLTEVQKRWIAKLSGRSTFDQEGENFYDGADERIYR